MNQAWPWLLLVLSLAACAKPAEDEDTAGAGHRVDAGHDIVAQDGELDAGREGRYRIDFSAQDGGTLPTSNDTVVLSLGLTDDPSDAMLVYTRIGCPDDADDVIGSGGSAEALLPPTLPVHLTYVAVEQVHIASGEPEPAELGEQTCFSYRTSNGKWQPTFRPIRATVSGDSVVVEAGLDLHDADALAIFLPTYTNLVSITYEAVTED
jgi:hypothetical protein